jgi:SAM-dependent methyltransferase
LKYQIDMNFVKKSFSNEEIVNNYYNAVENVGLWQSEKKAIKKYFKEPSKILDIGCGTGRTTFGLYELGYNFVEGVDVSGTMINTARKISERKGLNINFYVGDALDLNFLKNIYDGALFSYNGIMHIPGYNNRIKALSEIKRILRPGATFIFTTHDDRYNNKNWLEFWEVEKEKWSYGNQDYRLNEYGDRIIEDKGGEVFIHIPTNEEVINSINEIGFDLIDTYMRDDICIEKNNVKQFSLDCRFWVVKKPL